MQLSDLAYSVFAGEHTVGLRLDAKQDTLLVAQHVKSLLSTVQGYLQLTLPPEALQDEQLAEKVFSRFLRM